MEKRLKPYTIIPEELYVQRNADKQVRNIIADMGRPGYVLVSRQMGKTNLLLYAKSKLETKNDAFVYIDLSNAFPTAKACFENIIDNAIEAYPEKFGSIAKVIHDRRTELKDTPPHKQHTNELRFLLQSLKGGKIVIILDEIDALTKTDYSDQIFSQIRSTYFGARVNYKEFFNLTYLLSGVVEPSEIIKDPKVSPFNIGQKIYLNDFTRIEFDEFIKTAKLNINKESADRIFFWTNGNPRISWDVCSEVENKLKSNECSVQLIDKIVQNLYLTSFDKAPIDNIREIVSNDREIRNSIVEIEYKKGKLVSDKIKSKLYLAGIINYDEDDIHIKNEVIRRSLSYEWIRSLEEADKGLINIAFEAYKAHNYLESLNTFEKYLKENEIADGPDKANTYYVIGHCAYAIQNFEKALEYFSKAEFDIEDEAIWHYKTLSYLGLTYYQLNKYEDSLNCLKKVIDNSKKDAVYVTALLNYGSIALKTDIVTHRDAAIGIFKGIVDETAFKREKLKESFINELKSIAYYNLAQICQFDGDIPYSISNYKSAISLGKEINLPRYILALLKINENKTENLNYLIQLIEAISSNSITPIDEDPERPMDFSYDEFRQICLIAFCESRDILFPKIESHLSKLGDNSKWKHLYDLALFSINQDNSWDKAIKLLTYIYEAMKSSSEIFDDEVKYNTLKLLAYGYDRKEPKGYEIEYIVLFKKYRQYTIDFLDMEIFINLIFSLTEKKQFSEGLKYANLIISFQDSAPEQNLLNYLIIYHLRLNIYSYLNDKANAIETAKQILELARNEKVKNQKSNLLGSTGLDIITQNAESILRPKVKNIVPIKSSKIYTRNQILKVRYKDGTILETKYKKVEKDISSGECRVLE
jgi:tetratricopeptide (TPR) repeat protein